VLAFKIGHASEQNEAGAKRQVQCEVPVMAIGEIAKSRFKSGDTVSVDGFLSRRSLNSPQLVLHANNIELIE